MVVVVNTFEQQRAWEGDGGAFMALILAALTAGYSMSILPALGRAFQNRGGAASKSDAAEKTELEIDLSDSAPAGQPDQAHTGAADQD